MAAPLKDLPILPGLYTIQTDRGSKNRWKDGDKVRFRHGLAEKIGGWTKSSTNTFLGKCRKLYDWQSLATEKLIGFGTHLKWYIWKGGSYYDVTPIRLSGTLGANPFTTVISSVLVTVNHVAHAEVAGDYVRFAGATAFNGVTINGEYTVTEVVDTNNYKITHSVAASASGSGGGAAVTYEYDIHVGAENSVYGFGWGAGAWGISTWGTPRTLSTFLTSARVWSLDKWGEDLIGNPRGGGIYIFDTSAGLAVRATVISGAPTTAKSILVSPENQHLVALGAHNGSADDPLFIRWSSSGDYTAWTASATNSAGNKRLTTGNEILCGIKARKEIMVFTDSFLWSMQFVGAPNWFDFNPIGQHGSMRGPNAAIEVDGIIYWMGENDFYIYDGAVKVLKCDVHPSIFKNINYVQRFKTYAGFNRLFGEIIWFYCSAAATEVDRYVIFNREERTWAYGTLTRTAYIGNSDLFAAPFAAATNYYLYDHESGVNDDGSGMAVSLESWDMEIGEGDSMLVIMALVPDFKELTGTMDMTMTGKRYPQATENISEASITFSSTTQIMNPRIKARQISLRLASSMLGDHWRFGTARLGMRPLGRK